MILDKFPTSVVIPNMRSNVDREKIERLMQVLGVENFIERFEGNAEAGQL